MLSCDLLFTLLTSLALLGRYARKIGKLLKGGEADTNAAAKLVLHDFQRGRLPYFCLPPGTSAKEAAIAYNAPEEGKEEKKRCHVSKPLPIAMHARVLINPMWRAWRLHVSKSSSLTPMV